MSLYCVQELRHRVYGVNLDTIEAMAVRTLRTQMYM